MIRGHSRVERRSLEVLSSKAKHMAKIKAFLQTGTARVLIELIAVSALALFGYAAAMAAMSSGLVIQ